MLDARRTEPERQEEEAQQEQDEEAQQEQDEEAPQYTYKRNPCSLLTAKLFYILCSFTGQYVIPPERSVSCLIFLWSSFWLTIFICVNLGSLVYSVWVIAVCPFRNCGYIYEVTNRTNWENISLQNSSILLSDSSGMGLAKYDDWQKTVITTAALSGLVSYGFIIWVLYSQYGAGKKLLRWLQSKCPSPWKVCGDPEHHNPDKNTAERIALNPFNDSPIITNVHGYQQPSPSTLLTCEQATYFSFFFCLNISLWISGVAIFFIIFRQKLFYKGSLKLRSLDTTGLLMQFLSQMCAIFSCFIFSKAAYGVSNRCIDVGDVILPEANTENPIGVNAQLFPDGPALPDTKRHFTLLKRIDQRYVRLVDATLGPYGRWFAVHWVLYTLTAFMSIAYVADAVVLELYGNDKPDQECHGVHQWKCILSLAYQLVFAVQHLILFLYPCFRAASVTAARDKMIIAVSKKDWVHVPLDEMDSFIQYLKDQKCSFKITILCAKFSFGFNTAFVSIFIGMLGVLLKLSS